jgi:hypothetical protein
MRQNTASVSKQLGWKKVEMAKCGDAESVFREQFQRRTGFSSTCCARKKSYLVFQECTKINTEGKILNMVLW